MYESGRELATAAEESAVSGISFTFPSTTTSSSPPPLTCSSWSRGPWDEAMQLEAAGAGA